MKIKRRLTIASITIAIAVFGIVIRNNDVQTQKFTCSAKGLAIVVGRDHDNTLWSIAHRYCAGNTTAAVDALYEKYGDQLSPGQIINLP